MPLDQERGTPRKVDMMLPIDRAVVNRPERDQEGHVPDARGLEEYHGRRQARRKEDYTTALTALRSSASPKTPSALEEDLGRREARRKKNYTAVLTACGRPPARKRRRFQARAHLKPTGSIYLHCDPTASHYLKVLMDGVFGPAQFRNEVTWQRTNVHNDAKRWGEIADILLYYGKTDTVTWNTPRLPHSDEHIRSKYRLMMMTAKGHTVLVIYGYPLDSSSH